MNIASVVKNNTKGALSMKKLILSLCVVLVSALFVSAGTALAVDDVISTKHNLLDATTIDATYYADVVSYGAVCVYCHTPHNKNATVDAPLWNRNANTSGYTPYTSPTLDSTVGQPTGVSLACLSCHDGTIGIDVIVNQPGATGDTGGFTPGAVMMRDTGDPNYNPRLTQDLSDDHPISMQYAGPGGSNVDTAFNDLTSAKSGGLRFFGSAKDEVQCASCHNPHDKTNGKFLRISNTSSALCLTCHIK